MARSKSKLSMHLFGVPYQFNETTDPRISSINSEVGRKFTETIFSEAPILTIIPGVPKYLPSLSNANKKTAGYLMLDAVGKNNGNVFSSFLGQQKKELKYLRLYDFEKDYVDYMRYVNLLCRTGAVFLGLNDTVTIGSDSDIELAKMDWSKYHWNSSNSSSGGIDGLVRWAINKVHNIVSFDNNASQDTHESLLDNIYDNNQFVQFYVDPEASTGSDGLSNSTMESQLKQLFDSGSSMAKEVAFYANSGGFSEFNQFAEKSAEELNKFISESLGDSAFSGGTGAIARILNIGGNVLKGDNIIIPEIYDSSSRDSSGHTVTIHLKTPYGGKLAYYFDIFVPLMHLMALVMPKQTSANSYNSPFLVKAHMEGSWTTNLGICSSISIQRSPESRDMDGLPNEIDVNLEIKDLYADLTMSKVYPNKVADNTLFINNASLIDFVATNCGLSMTRPNAQKKFEAAMNGLFNSFTDIPTTTGQAINERFTSIVSDFLKTMGLY